MIYLIEYLILYSPILSHDTISRKIILNLLERYNLGNY